MHLTSLFFFPASSRHEYDHLDGVVYIDRLLPESKQKVEARLKELVEEHDSAANGEPAL